MTRNAQETAAREAQTSPPSPPASPPPKPPRTDLAAWLGLTGVAGARRRGALLRRLLAAGDWAALAAALCLTTVVTSSTDVATLFWAVMLSPVWILIFKLHGLYDNDHRRIRHSTLDELPSLLSASALGTLALDGLLALSPAGPLSPESAILVGVVALCRQLSRPCCHALALALADRGHRRDRDRPGQSRQRGRRAGSPPTPRRICAWSVTSRPVAAMKAPTQRPTAARQRGRDRPRGP